LHRELSCLALTKELAEVLTTFGHTPILDKIKSNDAKDWQMKIWRTAMYMMMFVIASLWAGSLHASHIGENEDFRRSYQFSSDPNHTIVHLQSPLDHPQEASLLIASEESPREGCTRRDVFLGAAGVLICGGLITGFILFMRTYGGGWGDDGDCGLFCISLY
jgi:hypothetical protein